MSWGLLPASQGRGCICANEIESYMQFYMDTGCKTDKNSHKCVLWDRQPALRGQRGFSPRWEKFCACTPSAREGLSTLQITNTHTQSKPPHQAALPPWTPPEGWREIAPDHPRHSAASGDIWPLQKKSSRQPFPYSTHTKPAQLQHHRRLLGRSGSIASLELCYVISCISLEPCCVAPWLAVLPAPEPQHFAAKGIVMAASTADGRDSKI